MFRPHWLPGLPAVVLAVPIVLAGSLLSVATENASPRRPPQPLPRVLADDAGAGEAADYLLREGAQLRDELGEFHGAGQRIRFYLQDGKTSLTVLENQALERVSRVLDEHPTPRLWSVSGTVTEYRGANFLVLTRAVLKARNRGVDEPAGGEK